MKTDSPSFSIPGIPQVLVADYHNTLQLEPRIVGNVPLTTSSQQHLQASKPASPHVQTINQH